MSRPKPDALPLGDGPMNIYFNTSKDFFLYRKYKIIFKMIEGGGGDVLKDQEPNKAEIEEDQIPYEN